VDVVADLTRLPNDENSVDGFICDNVLEHVDNPTRAVSELYRVLKPGGIGYVSTPFLYPFHASPYDYQRWTALGLKKLFHEFSSVEVKTRSGLFSTLNVWLCYVLPSFFSFGSDKIYWLLVNISLFIFFPVKLLDSIAVHLPFSEHTAAVFYCIVKK
jgi:ubiquinone/menaquinone biosynthesis C-methylase UbiE